MKKTAYHIIKESFKGNLIHPLSTLKSSNPDIYESEVKKYIGREKLMAAKNPILDCLWNDVVQFACLDPRITFNKIKDYNSIYIGKKIKVFALDLNKVNPSASCLFMPLDTSIKYEHLDSQYKVFDLEKFQNLKEFPQAQASRWVRDLKDSKPLFLWSATLHFMHKGSIPLDWGEVFEFVA